MLAVEYRADVSKRKCVICKMWQHALCYGIIAGCIDEPDLKNVRAKVPHLCEAANAPEPQVCYRCLLGPNQTQLLLAMETLMLQRRALLLGLRMGKGYPNKDGEWIANKEGRWHGIQNEKGEWKGIPNKEGVWKDAFSERASSKPGFDLS